MGLRGRVGTKTIRQTNREAQGGADFAACVPRQSGGRVSSFRRP